MNKLLTGILLALVLPVTSVSAKVEPEQKHRAQMRLIDSFLANHHYQNAKLDDVKSKEILQKYIDILDARKNTFLKAILTVFAAMRRHSMILLIKANYPLFSIFTTLTRKNARHKLIGHYNT